MKLVKEVTQQQFEMEVLDATSPVLVDVYAPWCGPCRMLAPLLEAVAADYADRVKVVKLNVDDAPDLAGRFQISGVPTLLFFQNGRVVDRLVGVPSVRTLRAKLDVMTGTAPATTAATVAA
jgi:thioredoxin 1